MLILVEPSTMRILAITICLFATVSCTTSTSSIEQKNAIKAQSRDNQIPLTQHVVQFEVGKAALPMDIGVIVTPHARHLIVNPTRRVLIEGRADDASSSDDNHKLAIRRAEQVQSVLLALGVDQSQIRLATRPMTDESSRQSTQANRTATLFY